MGMVGIILLDLDEKVVEINQAAVDFLGLEREEAIGRTRQSLFESGFSDRTTGQVTKSQDSSIIEYSLYPNRIEDQVWLHLHLRIAHGATSAGSAFATDGIVRCWHRRVWR